MAAAAAWAGPPAPAIARATNGGRRGNAPCVALGAAAAACILGRPAACPHAFVARLPCSSTYCSPATDVAATVLAGGGRTPAFMAHHVVSVRYCIQGASATLAVALQHKWVSACQQVVDGVSHRSERVRGAPTTLIHDAHREDARMQRSRKERACEHVYMYARLHSIDHGSHVSTVAGACIFGTFHAPSSHDLQAVKMTKMKQDINHATVDSQCWSRRWRASKARLHAVHGVTQGMVGCDATERAARTVHDAQAYGAAAGPAPVFWRLHGRAAASAAVPKRSMLYRGTPEVAIGSARVDVVSAG